MFPALALLILAPTGGEYLERGVVLAIAAMCMDHYDVATLERLASDLTIEIIQALRPAAHQRAQHDLSVVVKGRAEHGRHRQDDVPVDHALMEDLAHLADPVIDVDFGTP